MARVWWPYHIVKAEHGTMSRSLSPSMTLCLLYFLKKWWISNGPKDCLESPSGLRMARLSERPSKNWLFSLEFNTWTSEDIHWDGEVPRHTSKNMALWKEPSFEVGGPLFKWPACTSAMRWLNCLAWSQLPVPRGWLLSIVPSGRPVEVN